MSVCTCVYVWWFFVVVFCFGGLSVDLGNLNLRFLGRERSSGFHVMIPFIDMIFTEWQIEFKFK